MHDPTTVGQASVNRLPVKKVDRAHIATEDAVADLLLVNRQTKILGKLKDAAGLTQAFADAGVDPMKPVIATCGSGVTAASIVLAATVLGAKDIALYDGSWAEWGSQADTPVVTGA